MDKKKLYATPEEIPAAEDQDTHDQDAPPAEPAPNGDDDSSSDSESTDDDDVPLAHRVKYHTNKWCSKNKPRKGEGKDEYRARVAKLLEDGMVFKNTVNAEAPGQKSTASKQIDAIAGAVFDVASGSKRKKPTKIIGSAVNGDGTKKYKCMWRQEKGYEGADRTEWINECDLLVWSDLITNFEAVSRIPLPLCAFNQGHLGA